MVGCDRIADNDSNVIYVNPNNAIPMTLNPQDFVKLEANPNSLLFDINNLEEKNGKYFVHSRNYIRAFDSTTGKYLFSLRNDSIRGDKLNIAWIDVENDTLRAYDMNRRCIYLFDTEGNWLAEENPYASDEEFPGEKPRVLIPVEDGFFTINYFTDSTTPTNPALTFYTSDGVRTNPIEGRNVGEGSFLMDGYSPIPGKKEMLYWEPLRDTIFIADSTRIAPRYVINSGTNFFPTEYQKLPYPVKASIFSNNPQKEYLSLLRYVHDTGDKLWFTLTSSDGRSFVCRYDKAESKAELYHFQAPDGALDQTSYLSVTPEYVYLEFRNPEDVEVNPAIYKIRKEDFGK